MNETVEERRRVGISESERTITGIRKGWRLVWNGEGRRVMETGSGKFFLLTQNGNGGEDLHFIEKIERHWR